MRETTHNPRNIPLNVPNGNLRRVQREIEKAPKKYNYSLEYGRSILTDVSIN